MLADDLARYAELHHSLGFKFRVPHTLLRSYVAFARKHGDDFVRADRAVAWAIEAPSAAQRRNRLLTVRRFALAMQAEDPRHEAPAADALGRARFERSPPFIYTPVQIAKLLSAAADLGPPGAIRPLMYVTLFGLLAATGLRVSEALALRRIDLTADGLVVRQTKFRKSRLVPLHDTTRRALDAYLLTSARLVGAEEAVFISSTGKPPAYTTVIAVFLQLARAIGLRSKPGQRGPRIHDLRHTFAVRSLEQCRNDRTAVARHIAGLSTYLGHAHVTDTYWYLQATPTLMAQIAEAGETLHAGGAV